MFDPVISRMSTTDSTSRTALADVLVYGPVREAEADSAGERLLHRHPGAELALLVISTKRVRVRTAVGWSLELCLTGPVSECLGATDLLDSAAKSLYAWVTARLSPLILVRCGLRVWCEPHRAARSPEPCGCLGVESVHR